MLIILQPLQIIFPKKLMDIAVIFIKFMSYSNIHKEQLMIRLINEISEKIISQKLKFGQS